MIGISLFLVLESNSMIADMIKNLRTSKQLTQLQLSKLVGTSRPSINAWEMGTSVPSIHHIVKLVEIFDVSADYILEIEEVERASLADLSDRQKNSIYEIINCYRAKI